MKLEPQVVSLNMDTRGVDLIVDAIPLVSSSSLIGTKITYKIINNKNIF